MLGVTKTVGVPCSLALVTGAAELPRETVKEPAVVGQVVSQDNCEAALVGRRIPLERKGGVLSGTQDAMRFKRQHDRAYKTSMFMNADDEDIADDACTYGNVFTSNEERGMSPLATRSRTTVLPMNISGGLQMLEPKIVQDSPDIALVEQTWSTPGICN